QARRALAAKGLMIISMKKPQITQIKFIRWNLWLSRDLTAGASSARRLCQLASARHCIDSARYLRIAVVENLRRGPVTIGRRQQVVAQLSLSKRAELVELFRSRLVLRFARREFLRLFPKRFGYREVFADEIVLELDRALNLVGFKSRNFASRQLERECKEHIAQLSFAKTDRTRLHIFIRRDAAATVNSASRISVTFRSGLRARLFVLVGSESAREVVVVETAA